MKGIIGTQWSMLNLSLLHIQTNTSVYFFYWPDVMVKIGRIKGQKCCSINNLWVMMVFLTWWEAIRTYLMQKGLEHFGKDNGLFYFDFLGEGKERKISRTLVSCMDTLQKWPEEATIGRTWYHCISIYFTLLSKES